MKQYKITVEEISDENTLTFEAESHENILAIVEKLKQHPNLGEDAAAFGLGLKLFTGVMMKQKSNSLFKDFLPHFKDFMKGLKGA
ncbi:hypothetical protein BZG02_06705 [Labilibaculum filiforme]|uniref:DUF3861 domain-containing protein n=1 Tax=Labilibaculum filiforme TaxID=1940526 RepID=A0A2N3I2G1_9BACT|nr:DUF3861 domain-containing protein [Labilibaculum filiforme]PKQ64491.1 hypothetical protein BZG02_06705 [Labilibaculum filiforme]